MEVGNVNSKHFVLALKVKSVLDPCEDENDDNEENEVSLGADSEQRNEFSDTDSEVDHSPEGDYIVAPRENLQKQDNTTKIDEDDTQDPEEDEQQLGRVKDWIDNYRYDTLEITNILSNFPDITVVLTEEIMDKLVNEGVLSKRGKDSYDIIRPKTFDYEFDLVKEENEGQIGNKAVTAEDLMYMKALYHTLPLKYVTVAKLQSKLEGDATLNTVRKMIDKMTRDGFVEAKGNRRLGKRVIHSVLAEKKLIEVKKALNYDAMEIDSYEPHEKSHHLELPKMDSNHKDMSTCGILRSIGSDLTRMKVTSDINQNGSIRTEQTSAKSKELGNTPTSKAGPVASRESFVTGNENSRVNGSVDLDEMDTVIFDRSTSSQDKRSRKTSTVKDPILQYTKRQKSQEQ